MLERSASSVPDNDDEHRRIATGYLVWPLAAIDMIREADDATIWSRLHTRQALVLGLAATVGYLVLLALPLIVVIAFAGISTTVTIALYGAGFLADIVAALALAVIIIRYSAKASRGELFAIPVVTPIVDRYLRRTRD